MGERGGTCKPIDRHGKLAAEPFDVEIAQGKVLVRSRGRLVRTLTGADANAVRAVIDDRSELQLVVARKTGNLKRGNER